MSTVLGFDFGTKHIGVAVGQTITATASALTTLRARSGKPDWDAVSRLISDWGPERLIVGLPLNMDGSEHALTRAARRFGNQLRGRYNLAVEFVDERLTSVEASAGMRPDQGIDQRAARIILQNWLDSQPK